MCYFNKTMEIHLKHALYSHMQLRYPKYANKDDRMLNIFMEQLNFILKEKKKQNDDDETYLRSNDTKSNSVNCTGKSKNRTRN